MFLKRFRKGTVLTKHTETKEKDGCNYVTLEFIAKHRTIMKKRNISGKPSKLGKVNQGSSSCSLSLLLLEILSPLTSLSSFLSKNPLYPLNFLCVIYNTNSLNCSSY